MNLVQLRKDAEAIFLEGVKAVNPSTAVLSHVKCQQDRLTVDDRSYDLSDYERVFVIGAGKASAAMAQPIEKLLGSRLNEGVVQVKYGHGVPLEKIHINEAGHPVPDEAGMKGAKQIVDILTQTREKDIILFLISGGGSALLPCPVPDISLKAKQQSTQCLLESGVTIQEMNAVRKHISRLKGGQLAKLAYPSTLVSLILSDVIGDDLSSIASGPTVPDSTTFSDCLHIVEKYGIGDKIPAAVLRHIERGVRGEIEDTPKAKDVAFQRTQNVIIGSNRLAVAAAKRKAAELGYHSLVLSTMIEGETRDVAKVHTAIAKEVVKTGNPVPRPACIISGGETTVTIRGKGLGGRNQEFVLASAIEIEGLENVVILSGGTDGTDGPTDAAGALADGTTLARAISWGLDAESYLRENDSYRFFQPLGDLLITGPTYTNVMDLRLVMVG